jgi:hypothetical protein
VTVHSKDGSTYFYTEEVGYDNEEAMWAKVMDDLSKATWVRVQNTSGTTVALRGSEIKDFAIKRQTDYVRNREQTDGFGKRERESVCSPFFISCDRV